MTKKERVRLLGIVASAIKDTHTEYSVLCTVLDDLAVEAGLVDPVDEEKGTMRGRLKAYLSDIDGNNLWARFLVNTRRLTGSNSRMILQVLESSELMEYPLWANIICDAFCWGDDGDYTWGNISNNWESKVMENWSNEFK